MQHETFRGFYAACRDARRIIDMLPELPYGMTNRQLYILDTIDQLEGEGGPVRMSDVSERMHVSRPNITKAIAELEDMGCVRKSAQEGDARVVLVSLTERGRAAYEDYVDGFFDYLSSQLDDIDEADMQTTSRTIERVRERLNELGPEALQAAVGQQPAGAAPAGAAPTGAPSPIPTSTEDKEDER